MGNQMHPLHHGHCYHSGEIGWKEQAAGTIWKSPALEPRAALTNPSAKHFVQINALLTD